MERRAIRVEPFSTWIERRRKGPINPVTVAGGFVFVSGLPPFDPVSGEAVRRPFPEQAEIVLARMKQCLEAAGSSMERVLKCNVYCTDQSHFAAINDAYVRYFVGETPARLAGTAVLRKAWLSRDLPHTGLGAHQLSHEQSTVSGQVVQSGAR